MAFISKGARLGAAPYICDSCLSRLRPRMNASLATAPRLPPSTTYATTSRRQVSRALRQSSILTIVPRGTSANARYVAYSRPYSASTASSLTTSNSGSAPLTHRRLIRLLGPDTLKFLQGLVTNNVDPTISDSSDATSFYAAFLDARGRVLWDVFIWGAMPGQCYIEVDGSEVESLLRHLQRHKLRSKISIILEEEGVVTVWAAWGIDNRQSQEDSVILELEDPRAPAFGRRILSFGKLQGIPLDYVLLSRPIPARTIVETGQYHLRRYLYGIAEGQKEIPRESALPMECNVDLNSGIDFRKGCYVGQELTIRTKHTGVVRKRILPVQLYHAGDPIPSDDTEPQFDHGWEGGVVEGADIMQLDENGNIKKGRAAGKFITGIGNVGLALCRLEMMTPMRVSAEGGSYKLGAEFGLRVPGETGIADKVVRIKAFVPEWFRAREKKLWDKGRQMLANS